MTETRTDKPLDDRLRHFLDSLDYSDKQTRVEHVSPRNVIGVITTPDFEGMDEAERQSEVWAAIHDRFSEYDQERIEFIFTNTPADEAEMNRAD